jgi:hypothetical protein
MRWVSYRWDDEDLLFLHAVDADGTVLRQVELLGPDRTPIAAADLTEWWECQDRRFQPATPATVAYERQYGGVADQPLSTMDIEQLGMVEVPHAEFDQVWAKARSHLAEHPRSSNHRLP